MQRGNDSKNTMIARENTDGISAKDTSPSLTTYPEFSHQHPPLLDKQEQKTFEDFLKQFEPGSEEISSRQNLTRIHFPTKEVTEIAQSSSGQWNPHHSTAFRPTAEASSSESSGKPNAKPTKKVTCGKEVGPSRSRKRKSITSNLDSNSEAVNNPGRGKKATQELLTEEEKKANHIASEQKRRQNIRLGFEQLVEIVPTLSQCHRSESAILQKSVEYIKQLLSQKQELQQRVQDLAVSLGEPLDQLDGSSSSDDNSNPT